MDDVGPVAGRGLGGVLGVELDGGLRVVDLELDLPASSPPAAFNSSMAMRVVSTIGLP